MAIAHHAGMGQLANTVTMPKAGDLIPAILEEISIAPVLLGDLRVEVARRAGFPAKLLDKAFPPGSNNCFQSKIDAAVAFLIRADLASKLGRGQPLKITRAGWPFSKATCRST